MADTGDPTIDSMTRDELVAALAAAQRDVEALRSELDETNSGVVALYSELDAQADELRKATQLKSRFLAYMSHEFRTPIGSILSNVRLLLDRVDGPLSVEQERQIRFIQQTGQEFTEIVNDLLDLAKVEAGRIDISPDWFEMMDLFSALRGTFKPMLTNPDVLLIFEEAQDVPKLYSDDRKLAQILRNFISNALKFTTKGEVRISAKRIDGDRMTFSVTDTGIGIAAEYHHAIFVDFTQIDSPIQKRLRGTGLGLSLSKKLAELLGGTVDLISEPGAGSTFSVTIPMHPPSASGAPA